MYDAYESRRREQSKQDLQALQKSVETTTYKDDPRFKLLEASQQVIVTQVMN
ncbi:hypothetical protein GHI93_04600 [Lactococcus hircilactis]|uniref:Uncharacterized protein n=1 Tax=Lactococcus hircilactis TaxID=1494462 RepID=A0A7X2D007_9LACT|nr:hypothetical protein [Lactococcus hircilactis]MQW39219.1 hypothetical protein [Lactococcus hircilactis]